MGSKIFFNVFLATVVPFSSVAQIADTLVDGPSVQVSQNGTVDVSINCPVGYKVVSGGWEASGGNQLFVPRSYPANSSLDQWLFQFRNNGTTTSTVNTFLVCRRGSLDTLIEGSSVSVNQNGTVDVSVNSPTNYKVVSGGWEASGGNQLFVPRSYPANSSLDQWLFQFRNNGTTTSTVNTFLICSPVIITAVSEGEQVLPKSFQLGQNYPNPFNPSTHFEFTISKRSNVKIDIYDALGQLILTLVEGTMEGGNHRISWNGTSSSGTRVPSGTYFYRLITDGASQTKKMIFLQ